MGDFGSWALSPVSDRLRAEVGYPTLSKHIGRLAQAWGLDVVKTDITSGADVTHPHTIFVDRMSAPAEQAEEVAHALAVFAIKRATGRQPKPLEIRRVAVDILCPPRRFVDELTALRWDMALYASHAGFPVPRVAFRAAEIGAATVTVITKTSPPETVTDRGTSRREPGAFVLAAAAAAERAQADYYLSERVRAYWAPIGLTPRVLVVAPRLR